MLKNKLTHKIVVLGTAALMTFSVQAYPEKDKERFHQITSDAVKEVRNLQSEMRNGIQQIDHGHAQRGDRARRDDQSGYIKESIQKAMMNARSGSVNIKDASGQSGKPCSKSSGSKYDHKKSKHDHKKHKHSNKMHPYWKGKKHAVSFTDTDVSPEEMGIISKKVERISEATDISETQGHMISDAMKGDVEAQKSAHRYHEKYVHHKKKAMKHNDKANKMRDKAISHSRSNDRNVNEKIRIILTDDQQRDLIDQVISNSTQIIR